MMEIIDKIIGGPLEWGYVDEKTGLWIPQGYKKRNLILYGAADILAKVASGNASYVISSMYFEFTNGVVPTVTPARDEGQSYYAGLSNPQDFIRSAIDNSPTFTNSDSNFEHNIVRFFATTSGSTGQLGRTFSQTAGSKVYGGALVATPTNSFSGDIVFARFYFTSPATKLDGTQIGIKWGMLFQ